MKKILCLVLSLVMAFAMISVSAFAEGESEYSIDEKTLNEYFVNYLDSINVPHYEPICHILGQFDKYVLFDSIISCDTFKYKVSRIVDGYVVVNYDSPVNHHSESPYDLGVYVYNGTEICTLEQAIEREYFKMSDIAHLSDRFIKLTEIDEKTITEYFTDYVHKHYGEDWPYSIKCDIIGQHNQYIIFDGTAGITNDMEITRMVDNYSVFSAAIERPYDIGIYVYDYTEICTLSQAVAREYFKMADIAHLSNRFTKVYDLDQETLGNYFKDYLDKLDKGYYAPGARILGKHDKYYIFFADIGISSTASTSEVIDNYVVFSHNIEYPYHVGIYVYDGDKICTLKEAVDKKYFRMADIAHMSDDIRLIFDVNFDDVLDMNDAVKLQRIAARLEEEDIDHYYWVNGNSDMEAVVKVQKYVAKLITDLS